MSIRPDLKKYVEYVANTGGNADAARFDDDWEPIGPLVRAELIPRYVVAGAGGKLELTAEGREGLGRS